MASNELLVRLGLETGSFTQKMKGISQEVKRVESEFKNLGTGVDNFGRTAQGMEAKMSKLTKQYELQKQKVSLYKDEIKKSTEVMKKAEQSKVTNTEKLKKLTAEYEKSVKATGKTSEASKKLKEELDKTKNSLTANEKASLNAGNRIRKLETDSNIAEAGLKKLDGEIKQLTKSMASAKFDNFSNKMKGISTKADGVAKTFNGVSRAMSKVSVPIMGLGAGILKVSMDFEAGMSKVASVSGATGDDLVRLSDKAKEMGEKTKFSATESADAMYYMGLAGWKTEQMLAGLPAVLNLAIAGGTDLGLTSDIVTDGLTAMGMSAEQAGRYTDIMSATMSNSNTTVQLMGETMKFAGAPAGALGIKMEDLSLAIGLMANAGIKGSMAGTALRSGLLRLVTPTDEAQGAMDRYGVQLKKNADGSVDLEATIRNLRSTLGGLDETTQASALSAIFGKEAVSGWMAVVNAGEGDVNKLKNAIDNSNGSTEKMAKVMGDNLKGKITELKSKLEGLGIQLGEILIPIASQFVGKLMDLATWFGKLSPATQENIVKFAGLWLATNGVMKGIAGVATGVSGTAKVLGGFSSILGKVAGKLAMVGGAEGTGALVGGMSALTTSVGAGAVAVLGWGAVIAGLGYGLYKLHKHLSEEAVPSVDLFADGVSKTTKIMEDGSEASENMAVKISEGTKKAVGSYMELDQKASQAMFSLQANSGKSAQQINADMVGYFHKTADSVGGINEDMKNKILQEFNNISDGTGNITEEMYQKMKAKMQEMLNASTDLTSQQKEAILKEYTDMYQQSGQMTQGWVDSQMQLHNDMGNKIKEGMKQKQGEQLEGLREYFAETNVLTQEEEQKILETTQQYWEQKQQGTDESLKEIQRLYQESMNQNGELTAEYASKIKAIQQGMKEDAVTNLSETEAESAVIMQRLKDHTGRMTTEMASKTIKDAEDTKQKTIQSAEDKYNGVIKHVEQLKKQGVALSKEQEEKMVGHARKQRDETVKSANDQKEKVISKIKEMDSTVLGDVNQTTGEIMNAYGKMKAGWDNWIPKVKKFWYKITGQTEKLDAMESSGGGGGRSMEMLAGAETRMFEPYNYSIDMPELRQVQLSGDLFTPNSFESTSFQDNINKHNSGTGGNVSRGNQSVGDDRLDRILNALENLGNKSGDVNQQINIWNPQPTPRELARQIKKEQKGLVRR